MRDEYRFISQIYDFVFDAETFFIGRASIAAVEFMAGKEHFKNFRSYLRKGGLLSLVHEDKFVHARSQRRAFNAITISTFRKSKFGCGE